MRSSAPLIALLAGVLTSVTPCALSSVPLVIGYVAGIGSNDPKRAFLLSLTFAVGMAATFTALGTMASLFGRLNGSVGPGLPSFSLPRFFARRVFYPPDTDGNYGLYPYAGQISAARLRRRFR